MPRAGGAMPAIAFSVVDLPAPLRPSNAMVCPSSTAMLDTEQDLAGAVEDVDALRVEDRARAHACSRFEVRAEIGLDHLRVAGAPLPAVPSASTLP